jgi:alanine racemase
VIDAELTIDLAAIRRNVARIAAIVRPARYAAVVKSNAYGHGLPEVARALADDVDAFCVYRADEAATIRAAGVATPILILGPVAARDLESAYAARAAIALWSDGSFARDVARVARSHGGRFAVHAKIETGVMRLGVDAARASGLLTSFFADADLDVRGAFTHLAAAEELESAFTMLQLERFENALAPLRRELQRRGTILHAAASAAALLYPRLRLDMVRPGIATYGIWPSQETRAAAEPEVALEGALRWTTRLVVVRDVEAGRSVGYGCTYRTTRPSRIGILPVGYAEGIPRAVSGAGEVLVAGRRAPLVGRICMNMCFVDVTDIANAVPGVTVTLIGSDGDERIDPNDVGTAAHTIGYEIVARLPAELPRRYGDVPQTAIASARSSVPS